MSKVFRDSNGVERMRWFEDGSGIHMAHIYKNIPTEDIPAFIVWLQVGPPKKRWRITRTFDERPEGVHFSKGRGTPLTDDDVEQVHE